MDLNLFIHHNHLHSTLQFISGLGPRKSKKLIVDAISRFGSKKIQTREKLEMFLGKTVYASCAGFIKIKVPQVDGVNIMD